MMDDDQETYMYGGYPKDDTQVKEDARLLQCFYTAGVENWDGYQLALDIFNTFKK